MDIRQRMKSLYQFGRVRSHIRVALRSGARRVAVTAGRHDQGNDADTDATSAAGASYGYEPIQQQTGAATTAAGNLFHCGTCDAVYIDEDKQACTSCETEVEQVRSTFASR